MPESFRVVQIGFGTIGRPIAKAIAERKNLDLVGVIDVAPEVVGKKISDMIALDTKCDVEVGNDIQSVFDKNEVDVAVILTSSSLVDVAPLIKLCLKNNADVVSICEELSFPYARFSEISREIDKLGKEVGKAILGTGINPGYLMDILPIVLTAPCQRVDTIQVTRTIDSAKRRDSFQKKVGTGMTVSQFEEAMASGEITGHVGLVESMRMIDAALGLRLDSIEEYPPEPVVAENAIETSFTKVDSGQVLGLRSKGVGKRGNDEIVKLEFVAFANASPEYDEVVIEGHPRIHQSIEGGVHGDYGTGGMVVNMIPLVVNAEPGLLTMLELPCIRNTQNIWKG